MNDARPWTPADYLIHGEFCPIDEIEPAIERARRRAEATAALLLVADERAVLRTLCGCSPGDDGRVQKLAKLLQEASFLPKEQKRKRSTGLQDYIRSSRSEAEESRFPRSAGTVLEELAGMAESLGDRDLAGWLAEGTSKWVPVKVPDQVCGASLNVALLLFEPRSQVHSNGNGNLAQLDADVVDIFTRVSTTAHANVRRDDLIMKRLDDKLDPAEYGTVKFDAVAKAMVELAVEVSGSEAGACYLVDHSEKIFELRAPEIGPSLTDQWKFPENFPTNDRSLAAAANNEHLTLQLPPGLAGRGIRHTGEAVNGFAEEMIEVATPLPGPLATPKAPAVGVLTVMKRADARPYGAYEVAVVRNVALRLALIANTVSTTQAARMFTRLSMRGARVPVASPAEKRSTPPVVHLPDDIAEAVPAIEEAMATMREVTRAATATFRAALPSGECGSPHGLTLARVAGFPTEIARNEEHAFQPYSEGGYNWLAVREGEIQNIPVVRRNDANFSEHRKNTKSELAVPVYVEDRVVGVVNLESPVKHAFDAHVELAQAAAEHIGLAIANARLALAAVVQELATDVLREAHDITHAPKELTEDLGGLSAPEAKRVKEIAEGIHQRLEKLRVVSPQIDGMVPQGNGLDLPSLVRHAVERLNIKQVEYELDTETWNGHDPGVALAISKALQDILGNARWHREEDSPPPRLQLLHDEWGGHEQDILIVRVQADMVRKAEQAINIYRCPLNAAAAREGRDLDLKKAQLGAYLAGLQIRRVGGEVHLSYEDNSIARVIVAVPSPTAGQPAEGKGP